jgi:hypothetical protein
MMMGALVVSATSHAQGSVSGIVQDGRGTPQIGALVELLRPDSSVVSQVFTDDQGRYSLARVLPGIYGLKATGALFLPTLRENLRILSGQKLVVDVRLNTLLEAFRWIPAQRRAADEPEDDWTWTLRSAANRPLLRVLEDGPLVVVSSSEGGSTQALKARVTVRGGASQFGDGGIHQNFEFARTRDGNRELIWRADLSQADTTGVNTVVGYEQNLAPNSTLRTVAAFEDRPEIAGARDQGLQSMLMRTAETLQLMDGVKAEVGNEIQAVRLGRTLVENHPFASVTVQHGDTSISYHVATSRGMQRAATLDRDGTLSPAVTERNGLPSIEHGLHQELAADRKVGNTRVQLAVYRDHLENPVVNGGGTISTSDWNDGDLLYDPSTELLTAAGQDYSTQGVLAEISEKIGVDTWISFSYAEGDALTMNAVASQETLKDALKGLQPHHAQMLAASLNGKVSSTGTYWRATYRNQSSGAVTAVDAFDTDLPDPYLSFYVRQPIHCRMVPSGMEALIDVRNLLAQGYRPFVSKDGSSLYFAQAERSLQGGLSFSF